MKKTISISIFNKISANFKGEIHNIKRDNGDWIRCTDKIYFKNKSCDFSIKKHLAFFGFTLFELLAVIAIIGVLTAPLLSAEAVTGDAEFVQLVLETDPNADDIELALKGGANVNAKHQDLPVLYYAITRAISTKNTSIVKLLIQYKADVNIKVYDSPLLLTVLSGLDEDSGAAKVMEEIVRILVKGGADVNAVDKNNNTPLAILAESDAPYAFQLAKILRDAGATVKGKTSNGETLKTDKTNSQKTTKLNLKNFSMELPNGWNTETDKASGMVVITSKNVKTGILILLMDSSELPDLKEMDGEAWKDGFLEGMGDVGGIEIGGAAEMQRGGYYKIPFTKGNQEGYLFTGLKDGIVDTLGVVGNGEHPETRQILLSIKAKQKRPHLDAMITAATKTPQKAVEKPKTANVSNRKFEHFTIDLPRGWTSSVDKGTGLVSFTSPDNKAVLAILLGNSESEDQESEEWMNSVLASFPYSDTAEPADGGYYKSSFTNPNKIKGYILAGAKDGLADTVTVMGNKPELKQMFRSLKTKSERPYLNTMIKSITGSSGKIDEHPSVPKEQKTVIEETPEETESDTRQKTRRKIDDRWTNVLSGKNEKKTPATKTEKEHVIWEDVLPDKNEKKTPVTKTEKKPVISSDLDAYKVDFALQEIRDPQLNNELAVTIAIPNGWKLKDQNIVQWNPNTYGDPARVAFTLQGQKDEAECSVLSQHTFYYDYGVTRMLQSLYQQQMQLYQQTLQMAQRMPGAPLPPKPQTQEYKEGVIDGGRIIKKPMKPEELIQWLVSQDKKVSNVQIKKVEKPKELVVELEKSLPELNQQLTAMLRQSGSSVQFKGLTADSALVGLSCFRDGKKYEQQIAVIITYLHAGSAANIMTNANDECVFWTVSPLISSFTLEGKYKNHAPEFATILGNSKVNPVWKAKVEYLVAETQRKIQENQLKHQKEIQESMLETQNYIAKTRQSVFQNRANTQAKVNQGWIDAMTGTDRIKTPNGKIIPVPTGSYNNNNLPNGYKKVPWAW